MMKPIVLNVENINLSSLEDLEYKYLLEVPKDIRDRYNLLMEHRWDNDYGNSKELELFEDINFKIYRWFGKIEESNLFLSEGTMYKANCDKDFLLNEERYSEGDVCIIITDELLEDIKGKKFETDGWRGNSYVAEILQKHIDKELTLNELKKHYFKYVEKEKQEQEERRLEAEKRREEEIKGNEKEIEDFNKAIWNEEDDDEYGTDETIYRYGDEHIFNKKINELFTIEELNHSKRDYNRYGVDKLNWVETLAIGKEVDYKYISKDKKRSYVVKFKKGKMYVDSVVIPKNRSVFFVSRANGDTDSLKQFKELSAVKVEFLGLKSISLNTPTYTYKNIPIEVEYIDKMFKVTLFDNTIKVDWKDLELFRWNIQRLKTNFYTNDIENIRNKFNLSKEDLFNFMKKTQLLDKLGEIDDEND